MYVLCDFVIFVIFPLPALCKVSFVLPIPSSVPHGLEGIINK